jgi:metal-responsive CopG/Arc/MetJ family transcriptional regulator
MKTAVSVDDQLMREADRVAREIGVSRSRLFSLALESYLEGLKRERMIEQLNQVYATEPGSEERRLAGLVKEKFRSSTIRECW